MTVSKQIIEVLNALCEKFGIVVDWTTENIVPYLEIISQKIITYSITTDVFWIICGVILSIAAGIAIKWCVSNWVFWDENPAVIAGAFFGPIALLIGIVVILFNIYELCTCLAFPELRIIEFASQYLQ